MIWSRQEKGTLESSLINDSFHVDVILRKKNREFASLPLSGIKISRIYSQWSEQSSSPRGEKLSLFLRGQRDSVSRCLRKVGRYKFSTPRLLPMRYLWSRKTKSAASLTHGGSFKTAAVWAKCYCHCPPGKREAMSGQVRWPSSDISRRWQWGPDRHRVRKMTGKFARGSRCHLSPQKAVRLRNTASPVQQSASPTE